MIVLDKFGPDGGHFVEVLTLLLPKGVGENLVYSFRVWVGLEFTKAIQQNGLAYNQIFTTRFRYSAGALL